METTPDAGHRGETATLANTRTRARVGAVGGLAVLVVVGLVVPLVVAQRSHALGVPRSDDWSYLVTLFRWIDTGRLEFNGWVSMTLVGQLVLTAPVVAIAGRSVWAVQVWSACIGLIGLVGLVGLGRLMLGSGRGAWFVAVTVAGSPLWAPLATTYMTDVPAFSAQMIALALAGVAFRRRPTSIGWLSAAVAVGFVGVSIRQYGLIPEVAILTSAFWLAVSTKDARLRRAVLVMAALVAISTAVLLGWWSTIPDPLGLSPQVPTPSSAVAVVRAAMGFLRLTGLLVFPLILLAGPGRLVRRAVRVSPIWTASLAALAVLGMALSYYTLQKTPFVGNYLDRAGVLANDVITGFRLDVIPSALFDALVVVGIVGGVFLVVAMIPIVHEVVMRLRFRDFVVRDPMIATMSITVIGFAAAYGAAVFTDLPIFDRYALPVSPLVGLLLVRAAFVSMPAEVVPDAAAPVNSGTRSWRLRSAAPVAALLALGVVSLAFATDSASFDATRHEVAARAVRRGYGALQVDGGFEWVAYHRGHGPLQGYSPGEKQRLRAQYYRGLCVTVLVNPSPRQRAKAISVEEVRGLFHRPYPVVALRNDRPCGSPAPATTTRP